MKKPFPPFPPTRAMLAFMLGAALLAVLLAAPYAVPLASVRQAAAVKLSSLTGQDVTFTGMDRHFAFPLPSYALRNVQIAGSAGGPALVRAPRVEARLSLLALLGGSIEVGELAVVQPKITLATEGGRSNWRSSASMLALFDPQVLAKQGKLPPTLHIGDIRVIDGTVLYTDSSSNTRTQFEKVNLLLHWPDIAARLALRGDFVRGGAPVKFTAALHKPAALFRQSISPFDLALDTAALKVELDGEIFAAKQVQADAQMHLSSPSLQALASWAMPQVRGLPPVGEVSATARLKFSDHEFVLENAVLDIGASHGEGTLAFRDGARPALRGTLDFDQVDLAPFMTQKTASAVADEGRSALGDALGKTQALSAIDMDLRLSAASLLAPPVSVGNAALSVLTRKDRIELSLGDGEVYGGEVTARLVAETLPDGAMKALATANLSSLRIDDALREIFGIVKMTGTGDLSMNLNGSGVAFGDVLASLSGDATLRLKDGSLAGIDMTALMRNAGKSAVDAFLAARGGSSVIDAASARFDIAGGIARTSDASMSGPGYSVLLNGTLNLASGQMDMKGVARPQAGVEQALTLPFAVKGPVANPIIAPDTGPLAAPAAVQ